MQKLIIEAAINEQVNKDENPHIPYSIDECVRDAIACADAGAAIVHFHARDPLTGDMLHPGTEFYTEALQQIRRERPALLVYPTYGHSPTPEERFSHVKALATNPAARLRMATIDPGAVNMTPFDEGRNCFASEFVLDVKHAEAQYVMGLAREYDFPFSVVIREPGGIRHVLAYCRMGLINPPLFFKICLNDDVPWGMPPSVRALEAYLSVIPPEVPHIWMVFTYGRSHWSMILHAIASGGHVRTGIGDYWMEHDGHRPSNAEMVTRVVEIARRVKREVATPEETMAILQPK
jgi:3-keto-5-aminohexanoate cleavage enzyme